MLQSFLWFLFAIVLLTLLVNALLVGPGEISLQSLAPNLLFLVVITAALLLNRQGKFKFAAALIIGLTLLASSLTPLLAGVAGNEVSLFLLFAPLVLAGLVLGRFALYFTALWCALVVLAASLLQGGGLPFLGGADSGAGWVTSVQFVLVVAIVTFFLDRFGLTFNSTLRRAMEQEVELNREMTAKLTTQEQLNEEKQFSDAVIQSLPGLFYVRDEEGHYLRWNRRFLEVLGYTDGEVRELQPFALFNDSERELIRQRMGEVFNDGHATADVNLVTKTGEEIPFFLSASKVKLGDERFLVGVGIDHSELRTAQLRIEGLNQDLRERLRRLNALREIDRAIIGSLDLNLTLRVVLEQVRSTLHVDAATLLLYKASSSRLLHGASQGFRNTQVRRSGARVGEGLAGMAALNHERQGAWNREEFRKEFMDSTGMLEEDFEFYTVVPLVAKGKLQGVLELFHRSPLTPTHDWLEFLEALAGQAAIALDGAALFESLERNNKELLLAYDTTIEGWAKALDLRDEETEGHSRRVTELTVELAERMGMEEEQLAQVRRGALLHDIGKMGIPDSVLLKPGKLNDDEWELMKKHTVYANELLSTIPFLRPAIDIPYSHHEKWDGSGYPQGLSGEQIPLAARIFAVVDVYDALTSDRPYRKAWSEERALAYIEGQAGQHFDPDASRTFCEMMRERKA